MEYVTKEEFNNLKSKLEFQEKDIMSLKRTIEELNKTKMEKPNIELIERKIDEIISKIMVESNDEIDTNNKE